MKPDFTAPLPTHFDTGHPIAAEPGIFTVYRWNAYEGRWVGILSSSIISSAEEFADECAMDSIERGHPVTYIVREGKLEKQEA